DLADRDLLRLADVDEEEAAPRVEELLELVCADLPVRTAEIALVDLGRSSRLHSAELLIVDELRHGRVRAADGTLGVLAELELAEAHAERVEQEEPSDERRA